MSNYRTQDETRHFDLVKLIILALLIIILVMLV